MSDSIDTAPPSLYSDSDFAALERLAQECLAPSQQLGKLSMSLWHLVQDAKFARQREKQSQAVIASLQQQLGQQQQVAAETLSRYNALAAHHESLRQKIEEVTGTANRWCQQAQQQEAALRLSDQEVERLRNVLAEVQSEVEALRARPSEPPKE